MRPRSVRIQTFGYPVRASADLLNIVIRPEASTMTTEILLCWSASQSSFSGLCLFISSSRLATTGTNAVTTQLNVSNPVCT